MMSLQMSNSLDGPEEGGGFYTQQSALESAAVALRQSLPDGYEYLEYEGVYLSDGVSSTAVAFTSFGKRTSLQSVGWDVSPVLTRLREAMYRPGEGSWFIIRMTIWADGRSQARFSYDEEPPAKFIIGGVSYLTDQHYFPIDEDKQPEWLKRKLAESVADLRHFGKRSYPGWLQDMIAAGNKPAWL